MHTSQNKIEVIHFQRKPRPGFNYSIESIFEGLRCALKDKADFSVKICSRFNDGYFSKIYNIIEASLRQKKNAISHITGEVHFLNLLMRKKNVLLTIHDCRFMGRKKGMTKKLVGWLYLKAPVQKATLVTAVSENTKKDIIKYTGCMAEKITVIPDSIHTVFKPAVKPFNETCPVILHIGDAPNKNLSRLIDAIKEINCKLVIVGKPGRIEIEKLENNKTGYTIKPGLSVEELYHEYIHCDIVAFISTFEGFGMPIIEAQVVGRPVITSGISSMPEVAGEGACLVNPLNVGDIRNGLLKIIHDEAYRNLIIENGSINCKRFDRSVIANQYLELYKVFRLQG